MTEIAGTGLEPAEVQDQPSSLHVSRQVRLGRQTRPWFFTLAVVVAAVTQLLTQLSTLPPGQVPVPYIALNAFAILLAAVGWSRDGASWLRPPLRAGPLQSRAWLGVRGAGAAAGLVAMAGLVLRLRTGGNDALALAFWLSAIMALVTAFLPKPRSRAILAWVRTHRIELLLVTGLVALAAPIFLLNLNATPWRIQSDETAMGTDAAMFASRDLGRIFDLGWLGHPRLFFYLQYVCAQIFGWNFGSIRIPAALSGWLMVPIAFCIGRVMFGRVPGTVVGVVAALLAATSVAQITYARVGLNNAPSELTYAAAFLFLALTRRSRQTWPAALAGVSAGFGLYLYYGSRMLPLIGVGYLALLVVLQAGWRQIRLRQTGAYIVTAGITVLPQALDVWSRPMAYLDRFIGLTTSDGSTANSTLTTILPSVLHGLWLNGSQSILVFFAIPDRTIFFYDGSRPLFDVLLGPLIVVGLGLLVVRIDDPRLFLLGVWFWPNWLAGGAVPRGGPYSPHIVCVFLAVIVVASMVVTRAAETISQVSFRRVGAVASVIVPIAFVLTVGYRELQSYWQEWSLFRNDDSATQVARWSIAAGPRQFVMVEGGGIGPTMAFAATSFGALQRNFPTWPSRNVPTLQPGATITFYFEVFTGNVKYVSTIQQQFPGGKLIDLRGPNGDLYYKIYDTRVPAEPIVPAVLDPNALRPESHPLAWLPPAAPKVLQLIPVQLPEAGQSSVARGLAFFSDGRFALADSRANLVRIFDQQGRQISTFVSPQMQEPVGLVAESSGDLLVLDASSPVVLSRFGWDGTPKGEVSTGGGFYHPRGVAAAPDGSVTIADTGNQRIVVRSADGQIRSIALPRVPGWKAGWPVLLATGSNGSLLVATSDGLIARIDAAGQISQSTALPGLSREPAGFSIVPGTNEVAATWPDAGLLVYFDQTTLKPVAAIGFDRGDGGGPASLGVTPTGSLAILDTRLPALAILR